ncbi:uncharacterized protein LOC107876494 [Capsicum annuum]|uniref:uncharacterized protein LOC107876494 n=1 Tax=Capsicum annuum TaxID=4072 RepID=UPI001FB1676D|nr:uncharacterized protein LOC107876494 [Capsicum annuum]
MELEHLFRSGSDHTSMQIKFSTINEHITKSSRFLNMWLSQKYCMEVIKANQHTQVQGNPFIMFHHKMKQVKNALVKWSMEHFDNIFQEIATLEEINKVKENQFEERPIGANKEGLFKAQAELNVQLRREKEFWKQNTRFQWFKDGESNTKFFHAIVKRRKNRLKVQRIQNKEGEWIEDQNSIADAAVAFYQNAGGPDGMTGAFF